jgi:UDP-glucose 4-epimerase
VLDACRQRRVKKLVVRSQTLLYGPRPDNPNFLTESHELRGLPGSAFLSDKIDAEREVARFARERTDTSVTVLRLAPVLGPTVQSWVTRWLSRRLVPTAMGFDPLVQFVHELDAVAAFVRVLALDVAGTFNVVGDGVLPISTVAKLAGRAAVPVPYFLVRRGASVLWTARLAEAPPELVAFLRYLCVASGERARDEMGFRPAFTSREAVLDFGGTLRLREARLLMEAR